MTASTTVATNFAVGEKASFPQRTTCSQGEAVKTHFKIEVTATGKNTKRVHKLIEAALKDIEDVDVSEPHKVTPRTSRSARLAEAEENVENAKQITEELKDEMEQWRDQMPENLQGGEKYSEVEQCCDALDSIHSDLENIDFSNVEFPGMF